MRGDTVCQAPTPTARSISVPRLTVDFELYGILRAYSAVLDASATTVGFGRDATPIEIPENVEKQHPSARCTVSMLNGALGMAWCLASKTLLRHRLLWTAGGYVD